jgi:purine-cytosine permease-like protein
MPVSWLPLAGDYSREAKDGTCAALMPFAGYFLGSAAMYVFGLLAALKSGGDFFAFIGESRFRFTACAVVVLSTMTTAFLDLYSAAVSSGQFFRTAKPRIIIAVTGALTVLAAVFFPAEKYGDFLTNFLTLIGMIFVPVYGVVFIDFFMKPGHAAPRIPAFNARGFAAAIAGMAVYRVFTVLDYGIPTLFSLAAVSAVYLFPLRVFTGRHPGGGVSGHSIKEEQS